jgi:serine/threonine protein kinase
MGAVYEVEHLHTGQHLALKVLLRNYRAGSDAIERFKREARASSLIKSDHVVRVTDADVAPELDGAPFLVMELLEGADLERVAAASRPSEADVLLWLRQVARALDKAHELGIVHRDLKPENLFLTRREDGTPLVKILDFGLAKVTADDGAQTRSGQLLGTPLFMSPEQADSGGAPISPRSDLYSLGLIAFKLLVGRDYWGTGTIAQLLAKILFDPPAAPSERGSTLGPGFDAWFVRACHRDPAARFASAHEEVEALAQALELPAESRSKNSDHPVIVVAGQSATISAGADVDGARTFNASIASARRSGSLSRRGRSSVLAAALVAAALGVGGWFAVGSSKPPAVAAGSGEVRVPIVAAAAPLAPVGTVASSPDSPSTGSAPPAPLPASASSSSAVPPHATASAPPKPRPPPTTRPMPSARPDAGPVDPLEGQN